MPIHLTMLLLMLAIAAASAQEPGIEDQEPLEIRRYTVEVIIFRYEQDVGIGSEIFVPDEPVVDEELLEGMMPEGLSDETLPLEEMPPAVSEPAEAADPALEAMMPQRELELLAEDEFSMDEIHGRFERLEVYEPVMHFGWTQSTWSEQPQEPLELSTFGTPPEGLEGDLTLYLSRYLHLVVNLQLDGPGQDADDVDMNSSTLSYGDYRALNQFDDPRRPGPVYYRIDEDRIFRSGELRYFDHPKFGVLAKVTREEEDPEELDELDEFAETELLGYPAE